MDEGIAAIYAMGFAEPERALKINAVVARKFGQKPPAGGTRWQPRASDIRAPATGARTGQPPPRDRKDITCVNCGRKGHASGEC